VVTGSVVWVKEREEIMNREEEERSNSTNWLEMGWHPRTHDTARQHGE
jgi:hypothetical protein